MIKPLKFEIKKEQEIIEFYRKNQSTIKLTKKFGHSCSGWASFLRRRGVKVNGIGKHDYSNPIKGKSFEEYYGKEKAQKMKENLSTYVKEKWAKEGHVCIGRHMSKETRNKISQGNKGKVRSEEFKELRRKYCLANPPMRDPKARAKVSKANIGRTFSPETRKKMSESRKKLYNEGKIKISATCFKPGKNHPGWLGGITNEPYGWEFSRIMRNKIRKRDNQICMLCGKHREKLRRALSVHHINYDKQCSIEQNLVSLCDSCHTKTSHNRKHWTKFFQDLLTEKYGYEYTPEGEIAIKLDVRNNGK